MNILASGDDNFFDDVKIGKISPISSTLGINGLIPIKKVQEVNSANCKHWEMPPELRQRNLDG